MRIPFVATFSLLCAVVRVQTEGGIPLCLPRRRHYITFQAMNFFHSEVPNVKMAFVPDLSSMLILLMVSMFFWLAFLLVAAGDVEENPGPITPPMMKKRTPEPCGDLKEKLLLRGDEFEERRYTTKSIGLMWYYDKSTFENNVKDTLTKSPAFYAGFRKGQVILGVGDDVPYSAQWLRQRFQEVFDNKEEVIVFVRPADNGSSKKKGKTTATANRSNADDSEGGNPKKPLDNASKLLEIYKRKRAELKESESERQKERRENETDEERGRRLQKDAESKEKSRKEETAEEYKKRLQKKAETEDKRRKEETAEEYKKRLQKKAETEDKRRKEETAEEYKKRLQKDAESKEKRRKEETAEDYKKRLQKMREEQRKRIREESEERSNQRKRSLSANLQRWLSTQSPDDSAERRKRMAETSHTYYSQMSKAEKKKRDEEVRGAARRRWSSLDKETAEVVKEAMRQRKKANRENESEEQKKLRRQKDALRKRIRRSIGDQMRLEETLASVIRRSSEEQETMKKYRIRARRILATNEGTRTFEQICDEALLDDRVQPNETTQDFEARIEKKMRKEAADYLLVQEKKRKREAEIDRTRKYLARRQTAEDMRRTSLLREVLQEMEEDDDRLELNREVYNEILIEKRRRNETAAQLHGRKQALLQLLKTMQPDETSIQFKQRLEHTLMMEEARRGVAEDEDDQEPSYADGDDHLNGCDDVEVPEDQQEDPRIKADKIRGMFFHRRNVQGAKERGKQVAEESKAAVSVAEEKDPKKKMEVVQAMVRRFRHHMDVTYGKCVVCHERKRIGSGGTLKDGEVHYFTEGTLAKYQEAVNAMSNVEVTSSANDNPELVAKKKAALEKAVKHGKQAMKELTAVIKKNEKEAPGIPMYVCQFCHRKLKDGNVPGKAFWNDMEPTPIEPAIAALNELGETLLAIQCPFMKIVTLPAGGQRRVEGKCVNVPLDTSSVVKDLQLPRNFEQCKIVPTIMRRRKEGHCGIFRRMNINCDDLWRGLLYFAVNNVLYQKGGEVSAYNQKWAEEFAAQEPTLADALLEGNREAGRQGVTPPRATPSSQGFASQGSSKSGSSQNQKASQNSSSQKSNQSHGSSVSHASTDAGEFEVDLGNLPAIEEDVVVVSATGTERTEALGNLDAQRAVPEAAIRDALIGGGDRIGVRRQMAEAVRDAGNLGVANQKDVVVVAPGEGQRPIPLFANENADVKSFPTLWPFGTGGMEHPRDIPITPLQYMNNRLNHWDARFQTHTTYIFFCLHVYQCSRLDNQINIQMNKNKAEKGRQGNRALTAADVRSRDQVSNIIAKQAAFSFMNSLRGSPAYWQKFHKDLVAFVRMKGVATWFFTMSSNDREWQWVLKPMLEVELQKEVRPEDVDLLDDRQRDELIRKYPVICANVFYFMFHQLKKYILFSEEKPLGEIEDIVVRTEIQGRGSLHNHCLLWTKESPKVGEASEEEIVTFIDDHVSAGFPPKAPTSKDDDTETETEGEAEDKEGEETEDEGQEEDTELRDLVANLQVHRHRPTCQKRKTPKHIKKAAEKIRNSKKGDPEENRKIADQMIQDAKCRFKFPFDPCEKTRLVYTDMDDPDHAETKIDPREYFERKEKELRERYKSQSPAWIEMMIAKKRRKFFQSIKVTVEYRRTKEDASVNTHSPELLRVLRSNQDLKFVTNMYALVGYLSGYLSKPERELEERLRKHESELDMSLSAKQRLRSVANHFLDYRCVAEQEAAALIQGRPLRYMSRKCKFLPVGPAEDRWRLLKRPAQLDDEADDSEDIFVQGVYEHYLQRAVDNEYVKNMSLIAFASYYDPATSVKKAGQDDERGPEDEVFSDDSDSDNEGRRDREQPTGEQLLHHFPPTIKIYKHEADGTLSRTKSGQPILLKMYRKRVKFAIIRYHRYSPSMQTENYFLSMLQLFCPHQSELELRPDAHELESYKQVFESKEDYLMDTINVFEQFSDLLADCYENLERDRQEELDDVVGNIGAIEEGHREEADVEEDPGDMAEFNQFQELGVAKTAGKDAAEGDRDRHPIPPALPPSDNRSDLLLELKTLKDRLNPDQLKAFDVAKSLILQLKESRDKLAPYRGKHLAITGPGGTGKSFMLQALRLLVHDVCTRNSDFAVGTSLVTAPTGCAAINVCGVTLHSAFLLPIYQGYRLENRDLSAKRLSELRNAYKHLHVVFIDEISMVSVDSLYFVARRLKSIFGGGDGVLFGNILIIAFGDHFQLKPVKGRPVWKQPGKNIQASTVGVHLWKDQFFLSELTIIERQRGDQAYAELLNRVRTGEHTELDIQMLESRLLSNLMLSIDDPSLMDVPFILPTNKEVDIINNHRQGQLIQWYKSRGLNVPELTIKAVDRVTDAENKAAMAQLVDKVKNQSVDQTGGLPWTLEIVRGTRVMLKINVNVRDGLVNGSRGVVTGWSMNNRQDGLPEYVFVKFDPIPGITVGQANRQRLRKVDPAAMPAEEDVIPIFPHEASFYCANRLLRRVTIPLVVSFATTVHKAQGASFGRVITSLKTKGKGAQAGLMYVALSRVTSLAGLYLTNLDPATIRADLDVMKELKRMRQFTAGVANPADSLPRHNKPVTEDDRILDYEAEKDKRREEAKKKNMIEKALAAALASSDGVLERKRTRAAAAKVLKIQVTRPIDDSGASFEAALVANLTDFHTPTRRYEYAQFRTFGREKLTSIYGFSWEYKDRIWGIINELRCVEPKIEGAIPLRANGDGSNVDTLVQSELFPVMQDSVVAMRTTGDGDCLWNSISILLYGGEHGTPVLRALTVFAFIVLESHIINILQYNTSWAYNVPGEVLDQIMEGQTEGNVKLPHETNAIERGHKWLYMLLESYGLKKWGAGMHAEVLSLILNRDIFCYSTCLRDRYLNSAHAVSLPTLRQAYKDWAEDLTRFDGELPVFYRYSGFAPNKAQIPLTVYFHEVHYTAMPRRDPDELELLVQPAQTDFSGLGQTRTADYAVLLAVPAFTNLGSFPGPERDQEALNALVSHIIREENAVNDTKNKNIRILGQRDTAKELDAAALAEQLGVQSTASMLGIPPQVPAYPRPIPSAPPAPPHLLQQQKGLTPTAPPFPGDSSPPAARKKRQRSSDSQEGGSESDGGGGRSAQGVQSRPTLYDWPTWAKRQKAKKSSHPKAPFSSAVNKCVFVCKGDITRVGTEAVVNAANSSLRGGDGIDKAMHQAAGSSLLRAYNKKNYPNGCPTGQAVTSPSFNIGKQGGAKYIVHCVGPIYSNHSKSRAEQLLESTYDDGMKEAVKCGARSIAFPTISTGIYAFPGDDAADIAVSTVRRFLDNQSTKNRLDVVFVLWSSSQEGHYAKALARHFPLQ